MKRSTLSFLFIFFFLLSLSLNVQAQETFPQNGVYDQRDGHYAFTGATLFRSYNDKVENATLLIKDGKVVAAGTNVTIPADAIKISLKGKYIYPSFVEIFADYGLPKLEGTRDRGFFSGRQQRLSDKPGAYGWNEALRAEFAAHEHFKADAKAAKAMRALGFGAALTHRHDGISRGSSTLVTLGDEKEQLLIIKERAGHHLSFRKGNSSQSYPGSLMGCIALLRQSYLDGEWYRLYGHQEETNLSLAAWNGLQELPQFFAVDNKLEVLRADKIAKEFGKKYIIKGAGDEYQRIDDIKVTGSSLIIPLNFPDAYDVTDPYDATLVSLQAMKHWELAPANAAHLAKAGINFAFTTDGLKNKKDFMKNLRKAIAYGLSETDALRALTHTPASMVGATEEIGQLKKGSYANFIISSGNIFDKDSKIHHNWVRGKAHVLKSLDQPALNGMYNLSVGDQSYTLEVAGEKPTMKIVLKDSTKLKVDYKYEKRQIMLSFSPNKEASGIISLSGITAPGKWSGRGTLADGTWVSWSAGPTRALTPQEEKDKKEEEKPEVLSEITFPFLPFGWVDAPRAETVLFKNATVWTNEAEGIIEGGDVLISNGKIVRIGKNLEAGNATVIDATGKHLTSGVIDEHTHIAGIRGINECTQEVTAEVRIGDVINPDDINIYRQLAGGVTAAQVLHGSCNPIGGQSGIIKMRWGASPEDMQIAGAAGFIKFALGENVKRSRWSNNDRFPNTRMGVEQTIQDAFQRAKDYEAKRKTDRSVRRDLELDALVEILNDQRHISCHSYVQSEINMLMRLAEKMDFKVNTFTHILEGYKVADKMAKHGAGGSTFSDWWAYKYEVIDAIPQNADIMHDEGVVVAINSDNAEMARRLNQEAGKAIMYGGTAEEEAWKFVTLNPAKLLHLDDRMGSLKAGKDADVVLWSGHPMEVYAKAEMTFVDGIKYFDRKANEQMQQEIRKEKARLIQKMLAEKKAGGKTRKPSGKQAELYHCDSADDEMR
ncbi:MAG: amidohydrolase family protein [Bacteroidota bacterium]